MCILRESLCSVVNFQYVLESSYCVAHCRISLHPQIVVGTPAARYSTVQRYLLISIDSKDNQYCTELREHSIVLSRHRKVYEQ